MQTSLLNADVSAQFTCFCCQVRLTLESRASVPGSDGRSHQAPCNGCYAPIGFVPLCPYVKGDNNLYGKLTASTEGSMLLVLIWMVRFNQVQMKPNSRHQSTDFCLCWKAFFTLSMIISKGYINKYSAVIMILLYVVYMIYAILNAYGVHFPLCFEDLNFCL